MSGSVKNYYSILEVSRHSSAMEIRQAYKKVSKKLHPDKNPSPNADVEFQQVKVAYDVSSSFLLGGIEVNDRTSFFICCVISR